VAVVVAVTGVVAVTVAVAAAAVLVAVTFKQTIITLRQSTEGEEANDNDEAESWETQ
jgi:hypothetical protein